MIKKSSFLLILVVLISGSLPLLGHTPRAEAANAANWQAGRIIDDAVFTDANAMSVAQIQDFLNQKVGTGGNGRVAGQCDTNGIATSELGGGTRAQYGAAHGNPTPFTCLKDYYEVPKTSPGPEVPASNYGGVAIPYGARSAAQLIWDAAQRYGISPKVLLVTIQKESVGPLTTDDWPFKSQYTYAMGAHCPDSGPNHSANCDPNYSGFSIQISESAALFRYYLDNMGQSWWTYKKPGNNAILYNPSPDCGSSNVYIQTKATAALYTYTPYQPNQAALNNLYGTGDSCSAYGNRNFWRIFTDWFDYASIIRESVTMNNISQPDTTPARGQTVSYTYSYTNNLSAPLTLDAVGLVGRLGSVTNGSNRDFGWTGPVTIQPGATQQFTFTSVIQDMGTIYVWPAINYRGTYIQYNNWGAALNIHNPNISLASPLTSSVQSPVASQTTTLSATIRNNEDQPINLSAIGIPVRFYDRYSYDTAWTIPSGGVIQPNATQVLSGNVTFDKPGPYTAWVSGVIANQYTTFSSSLNFNVAKAAPDFSLSYDETPNATPALGEDVVVKFRLKNNSPIPMTLGAVGVVGRPDSPSSGTNRDFGWTGPVTFAVGEEKSFTTFSSNISDLKNLYAWVAFVYEGSYTQYQSQRFMMVPHLPNLTATVPVTINSGAAPILNQPMSVTTTIKNNEPRAVRYSALGIPVRYYGVYSYDVMWQGQGTFAPSGQSGDSVTLNGTITFDKHGPYTIWPSVFINGRYITIGSQRTINL